MESGTGTLRSPRPLAWRLRVVALAQLVSVPFWLGALLAVPAAALCFYLAPTFAAVQSLADPGTRALAADLGEP